MRTFLMIALVTSYSIASAAEADNLTAPAPIRSQESSACLALFHAMLEVTETGQLGEKLKEGMVKPHTDDQKINDAQNSVVREALALAIEPAMDRYLARALPVYEARAVGACEEVFSPSEAHDVARFYRTPTGRKLLHGPKMPDEKFDPVRPNAPVLSPRDMTLIEQAMRRTPALRKYEIFARRLASPGGDIKIEPPNEEESAELRRTIEAFRSEHNLGGG